MAPRSPGVLGGAIDYSMVTSAWHPKIIERTRLEGAADALLSLGVPVFGLAIIAIAVENLVCARHVPHAEGFIPVIPFLPEIPWLAYAFGAILLASGIGLLSKRTAPAAALGAGGLMFLGAVFVEGPRYAANLSDMSVRTGVFEPLSLAALAWLLLGPGASPSWLARTSRYMLALSFVVFGVDHFLALAPIGTLIPSWIPWHVFWIAFFGAVFVAAGLGIAFNYLARSSAAGIGLMFAIWVFTLHLPRTLFGLYGGKGPANPDEWSSLFIAIALWGGSWALARNWRA